MNITLNGKGREISDGTTLEAMIEGTARDSRCVVAELNGRIIPREQWTASRLKTGDTVELLSFVGGG